MAYFATGPVASGRLSIEAVQYAGFAADLPALSGGQQRVDVTAIAASHQNGPNALVGRQLDVSDPSAPALITPTDAEALAARRPEWFGRLGSAYLRGRDDARLWWPDDKQDGTTRRRARDVLQFELPLWWLANIMAASQAVAGRAWTAMTAEQIEACVAHLETLLITPLPATSDHLAAPGIIRRWYDVGAALVPIEGDSRFVPNMQANGRLFHQFGQALTASVGYSDTYSVASGVLTPRAPDYHWGQLPGYVWPGADFDPENPA